MPKTNDSAAPLEFDPVIKLLHWLTLFLIVTVFALAFSVDRVPTAEKVIVLQLHRSVGLTIWVVTVGRLVWRQFARLPDWPADKSLVVRAMTNASENLLYSLLLIQPVLGLIHTNARGDRVNLFFLGSLPAVIGPDRAFSRQIHEVHEMVGYALLGLIGLHAAAGLYHHFWRRDRTLMAMLPNGITLASKPEQRVPG
jgi:cytochrome b561